MAATAETGFQRPGLLTPMPSGILSCKCVCFHTGTGEGRFECLALSPARLFPVRGTQDLCGVPGIRQGYLGSVLGTQDPAGVPGICMGHPGSGRGTWDLYGVPRIRQGYLSLLLANPGALSARRGSVGCVRARRQAANLTSQSL